MDIFDYSAAGGKNLIMSYIDKLPSAEQTYILEARRMIRKEGIRAFDKLTTRQLRGKLYEIKISQTRIMYIIADRDSVFFLHICKKQKGKAEKQEIDKAMKRAKKEGLM